MASSGSQARRKFEDRVERPLAWRSIAVRGLKQMSWKVVVSG